MSSDKGETMTSELNLDWLISVDDHVLEPSHLWTDRVAAKDRDRAPHQVVEGDMENPFFLVSPEDVQTESRGQTDGGQDQGGPHVEMIADFRCTHWKGSLTGMANVRVTRA